MIREKQKKTTWNNQRTRQTCGAIRQAVLAMLEHTPFLKITVTEVCSRARINR